MHILSTLDDHGLEASHQKVQRGEHPGRAGAGDNHRLCIVNVVIFRNRVVFKTFGSSADLIAKAVNHVSTGINRTPHEPALPHRFHPHAESLRRSRAKFILRYFLSDPAGQF